MQSAINTQNSILNELGAAEFAALAPDLKQVSLFAGAILHTPARPIDHVHFITSGLVSLTLDTQGGQTVEISTMGRESAAGITAIFDSAPPFHSAVVQIEGESLRIPAAKLRAAAQTHPALSNLAHRAMESSSAQMQQLAACNLLHDAEQRFCRWLLLACERMDDDVIHVTQETLSHLLGMHRVNLNPIIRRLQNAGLIEVTRGALTVRDKSLLKETSCECYEVIRRRIGSRVIKTQVG